MRAPFAKVGSAWIGMALYEPSAVPLTRRTASPISPSNLIGRSLVLTTQPIRYPLGQLGGGTNLVPTPSEVPTPLGTNTTFSFTEAVTSKSVSRQMRLCVIASFLGETHANVVFA